MTANNISIVSTRCWVNR